VTVIREGSHNANSEEPLSSESNEAGVYNADESGEVGHQRCNLDISIVCKDAISGIDCDNLSMQGLSCDGDGLLLSYTYRFYNIGDSVIEIESVRRRSKGDFKELQKGFLPPIEPGQFATFREEMPFEVCVEKSLGNRMITSLYAVGNTVTSGSECHDYDSYMVEVTPDSGGETSIYASSP